MERELTKYHIENDSGVVHRWTDAKDGRRGDDGWMKMEKDGESMKHRTDDVNYSLRCFLLCTPPGRVVRFHTHQLQSYPLWVGFYIMGRDIDNVLNGTTRRIIQYRI